MLGKVLESSNGGELDSLNWRMAKLIYLDAEHFLIHDYRDSDAREYFARWAEFVCATRLSDLLPEIG